MIEYEVIKDSPEMRGRRSPLRSEAWSALAKAVLAAPDGDWVRLTYESFGFDRTGVLNGIHRALGVTRGIPVQVRTGEEMFWVRRRVASPRRERGRS